MNLLIVYLLESFTGEICEETVRNCSICQSCFLAIDKYDHLQQQSEEIQTKLSALFQKTQKTIKQKPMDVDDEHEDLFETSDAQHSFYDHKVSKKFLSKIKDVGIAYNIETFQKAFFTEAERGSFAPKTDQSTKSSNNDRVSESFKKFTEKTGIDYNVKSFHKAFNNSEMETSNNVDASKKPGAKKKSVGISDEFLKRIERNGIDYNLETFQRAFGYTETTESDEKSSSVKSISRASKEGSILCRPCKKSFKTDACLQIHLATDHDRSLTGPFDCPVCFKTYMGE